jgi:nucleotide-binding universal stress UspA family protein
MFRKILVGYDGSDEAQDALALGTQLRDAMGGELIAAGVIAVDPWLGGPDYLFRDEDKKFAVVIADAAERIGAESTTFPSSSPARGLHDLAENTGADLILVGSSRHSHVGQVLAGSVGIALLHGSPCAVGVAPKGYRDHADAGFSTIVVGIDGGPEALQALTAASELASRANATLKLVTVSAPPPHAITAKGGDAGWRELKEEVDEMLREQLAKAWELVTTADNTEATFISGDPVEALTMIAEEPGTVLVVGSRGYGPVRRVLLGSVSTALVRSAPSPLLVTPRGMHADRDAAVGADAEAVS